MGPSLASIGGLLVLTDGLHAQEPPPVVRLPPVQVKAAAPLPETLPRPWVPSSLDIVRPDDVRASRPRVLPDALERLPGVTLQNQQGNQYQPDLSLRGFSASPVTGLPQGISVFLDGVRLNEPTVEEVNFDLIPLDDVDLIEIIRGPSVLFGRNTLGATVNMVTRRGQERLELVPEISGGSFGRQNYLLRFGGVAGPADYYLGLRYTEESGWRDDSSTRIARLFGKIGIRSGGLDATLSYQHADNLIKQPGSLPQFEVASNPRQNFTAGDFFAPHLDLGTLNASYAITEHLTLQGNAFVRSLSSEQFNVNLIADSTRLRNETLSTGGKLQASHRTTIFGRDNMAVVGGEYTRSSVTSRTFEEGADGQALTPIVKGTRAAGPTLKAVVAKTWEVGAYARPWPWLDVDASLYRTNVQDDIFSVAPTGTVGVFFQNVGTTRREGAEFGLVARAARFLEGYLNYAYTRATFRNTVELATPIAPGTEVVPAGNTFALVPKHRLNFGLAYHPWPWATLSLGVVRVSSQFLRGDEANTQAPLPAYWVANAGLSAQWRGFEAFVTLNNLLNNKYETFGTFAPDGRIAGAPVVRFVTPAPPINVLAGLRYSF